MSTATLYEVEVTRTAVQVRTFTVYAQSDGEACHRAEQDAADFDWSGVGTSCSEYDSCVMDRTPDLPDETPDD